MTKKGYSLIQVIIIIIITSVVSGITVGIIFTKSVNSTSDINYSKLILDKNVQEFLDIYASLSSDYYENVDKDKIIQSAIKAMTSALDESYTTYLDENATNQLYDKLDGKYEGIGIVLKEKVIVSIVNDSPAFKAGLQPNDEIIAINGIDMQDKTNNDIITEIKNANSDSFKMKVLRDNEELEFELSVTTLSIPNSEYYYIDDSSIAYLKINLFSNNISDEVSTALKYFNNNETGLIIDLRDNTGGYLEQAYKTASLFLKNGQIVYFLEDKNNKKSYSDNDDQNYDKPVIILVNNQTASAAEILTAALVENNIAHSVGMKTFGKGKVQHTYNMNNGGLIKYTSSKWLTPNGNCIDQTGIVPDYIVENTFVYDEVETDKIVSITDNQLTKAKELLQ